MNREMISLQVPEPGDVDIALVDIARQLRSGQIIPYLGAGMSGDVVSTAPMSPEALAAFFATKVALPKRAKGNAWASAQHIESHKHRATVTALMSEAFQSPVAPSSLQRWLAGLSLPLIVDGWYDGAMRTALADRTDWGEVQGITRAGIGEDRWFRFYDAAGSESDRQAAEGWRTLLYKPHGGVVPAKQFLISDADYVEVLTEIDIQTPIPEIVRDRRAGRSFLFLGCRFNDQLLRSYARQTMKRSSDTHYAVIDPGQMTRNEIHFLLTCGIIPLPLSLEEFTARLMPV